MARSLDDSVAAWSSTNLLALSPPEPLRVASAAASSPCCPRQVIFVLDAEDPRDHCVLHTSHDAPVTQLDFAPKRFGSLLLSADSTGVLQLWTSHVRLSRLSRLSRASHAVSPVHSAS
jgi:WD40 repeat protein